MRPEDTRILVIDDDQTQLNVLSEFLNRFGYQVFTSISSDDAFAKCRAQEFHLVICDLLLPKINGIQLAEAIAPKTSSICKFIFISGVFKDKQLIKKAMDKLPILGFLPKPIDFDQLKNLIEEHLNPYLTDSKPSLYQLLSVKNPSKNEIIQAINDTQVAHGLDLPLIYSLLLNAKLCGVLNVISANGEIFTVNVQNGHLIQINLKDSETFFGALLVEMGFTEKSEIEIAAAKGLNRKIGQKLVDQNALSPHVIEIIKKQQLMIRLSKSTFDSSIEISFNEEVTDTTDDFSLNIDEFNAAVHDIIFSKFNPQWLRKYYAVWEDHSLNLLDTTDSFYSVFSQKDILKPFTQLLDIFDGKAPLSTLINANLKSEGKLLMAIHFLITSRQIYFSDVKINSKDFEYSIKRYKNLLKELKSQNFFEILGVSQNTTEGEIARSYHELAKALHPDKLPAEIDKETYNLVDEIFSLITEAYTTLKHNEKRVQYVAKLQSGSSAELLKNEQLLAKGIASIKKHKYLEAHTIFESISQSKNKPSDINIYLVWAYLQKNKKSKSKSIVEKSISLLNEIPSEDRHSPDYFFVKGLLYKKQGQFQKAKNAFNSTIAMQPAHAFAKVELSKIKIRIQHRAEVGTKTLFVDLDVTEAITHMFKGKKGKKRVG